MDAIAVDQTECKTATDFQRCERCSQQFKPRVGSGSRAQRFCSTDCRQAFHSAARSGRAPDLEPQRDQRAPTCSGLPAVIDPPVTQTQTRPQAAESDFDWNDADAVALAEQHETAIYWNPKGDLVIRQRSWMDDDSLIFISKNSVEEFVDKLCDAVGIPCFGKPG
jgi:hypothetical protein